MKGFYIERSFGGDGLELYSGNHPIKWFCYKLFTKYFPDFKDLAPGERCPVTITIKKRPK